MLERKRKIGVTEGATPVTTTAMMVPTPRLTTQSKSKDVFAFLPCHLKMLKALYDEKDSHDVNDHVKNGENNDNGNDDQNQSQNSGGTTNMNDIDNHGAKKNQQKSNNCNSSKNNTNTASENPKNINAEENESIWDGIRLFLCNRKQASCDNQESAHLRGILREASILISKYNNDDDHDDGNHRNGNSTIIIGGKNRFIINNDDGEPCRKKAKTSKNTDMVRSNNNDDVECNRVLFPKHQSFIAAQSQQHQYQRQYQHQYQQQQIQLKSILSPQIITTPSRRTAISMYNRNHALAPMMSPPCSNTLYTLNSSPMMMTNYNAQTTRGNDNHSVSSITLLTKILDKRLSSSYNEGKMKQLPFIPLLHRVKKTINLLRDELVNRTTGAVNNIHNNSSTGPVDPHDQIHGNGDDGNAHTKESRTNDSSSDEDVDEDDCEIDVEGKYNQYLYLVQGGDGNENGSNLRTEYGDNENRDNTPAEDQIATIKSKLILWKLLEASLEAVVTKVKA